MCRMHETLYSFDEVCIVGELLVGAWDGIQFGFPCAWQDVGGGKEERLGRRKKCVGWVLTASCNEPVSEVTPVFPIL